MVDIACADEPDSVPDPLDGLWTGSDESLLPELV